MIYNKKLSRDNINTLNINNNSNHNSRTMMNDESIDQFSSTLEDLRSKSAEANQDRKI